MAADDDEVTLVRFVRPDHFPLVALNNDKSAPSDRENKRKKTPLKVPQQSPIVLGLWQMAVGAAAVKFRHFAKQIQILSPLCQCLVADSSYAMEQEQVGLACRHSRLRTTLSLEHKLCCVGIFRKKNLTFVPTIPSLLYLTFPGGYLLLSGPHRAILPGISLGETIIED